MCLQGLVFSAQMNFKHLIILSFNDLHEMTEQLLGLKMEASVEDFTSSSVCLRLARSYNILLGPGIFYSLNKHLSSLTEQTASIYICLTYVIPLTVLYPSVILHF